MTSLIDVLINLHFLREKISKENGNQWKVSYQNLFLTMLQHTYTCTFILKWGVDGEMLTCNRSSRHLQPEDEISTNSFFHLLFVSLCFHVMSTKRGHHFTISPVYHVHYHMIDHVTKLWKITLTCYLGRRRPKQIERGELYLSHQKSWQAKIMMIIIIIMDYGYV